MNSSSKTVRERADAIERLQRSFSVESDSKRQSYIGLPRYSRSTASSLKRASLSGAIESNRIKRLRKPNSPNRESSPTLSETSVSNSQEEEGDEENTLRIALYARLLQYEHLNEGIEQQFMISEKIAENELSKAREILEELEFEEMQRKEEENSQNILGKISKQISECMDRIDIITKGGDGDLDKEKRELIIILNQLNDIKIPTSKVHNDIKDLMKCRSLIQDIIEA